MRTVEIIYKGVIVRDARTRQSRHAIAGEVVTVSEDDAAYLIGSGRARAYVPTPSPPQSEPRDEQPDSVAAEEERDSRRTRKKKE